MALWRVVGRKGWLTQCSGIQPRKWRRAARTRSLCAASALLYATTTRDLEARPSNGASSYPELLAIHAIFLAITRISTTNPTLSTSHDPPMSIASPSKSTTPRHGTPRRGGTSTPTATPQAHTEQSQLQPQPQPQSQAAAASQPSTSTPTAASPRPSRGVKRRYPGHPTPITDKQPRLHERTASSSAARLDADLDVALGIPTSASSASSSAGGPSAGNSGIGSPNAAAASTSRGRAGAGRKSGRRSRVDVDADGEDDAGKAGGNGEEKGQGGGDEQGGGGGEEETEEEQRSRQMFDSWKEEYFESEYRRARDGIHPTSDPIPTPLTPSNRS